MTSHLYRYLYKQGQLGGTVIDTLSTAVSGSLCCFNNAILLLIMPSVSAFGILNVF